MLISSGVLQSSISVLTTWPSFPPIPIGILTSCPLRLSPKADLKLRAGTSSISTSSPAGCKLRLSNSSRHALLCMHLVQALSIKANGPQLLSFGSSSSLRYALPIINTCPQPTSFLSSSAPLPSSNFLPMYPRAADQILLIPAPARL